MAKTGTQSHQSGSGRAVFRVMPDLILPSQYNLLFVGCERLTPHKRLMLAVLDNAVHDFQQYRHATRIREQRRFREAYEWFTMQDDTRTFSFVSVCEALGLEPDFIRKGLLGHSGGGKRSHNA